MIAWSIDAARASGCFDVVMVSTEDEEIAMVARSFGAEVPFLRSQAAAGDYATTADVLAEVLGRIGAPDLEAACCLYATAPFATAAHLREGRARLDAGDGDVVMPVVPFDYPIWRGLRQTPDGRVELIWPEHRNARSQDLEPAFHDVGQWYWFRPVALLRDHTLMGPATIPYVLPASAAQDIDTEEDWLAAEWKHERLFG